MLALSGKWFEAFSNSTIVHVVCQQDCSPITPIMTRLDNFYEKLIQKHRLFNAPATTTRSTYPTTRYPTMKPPKCTAWTCQTYKYREKKLEKAALFAKIVAFIAMAFSAFAFIKYLSEIVKLKSSIDSVYLKIYYRTKIATKKRQNYIKNSSASENSTDLLSE